MRVMVVLLTSLFVAQVANAQTTASETADVELLRFSWSKERVNWQGNPFGGPNGNFHQMQYRARAEKRASDAKKGNSPEATKIEREAKTEMAIVDQAVNQPSKPPRYYFFYRASVKNISAKAITEIDWDYVFVDAMTGDELGRRQFTSVQNIGPGKQKELSFQIETPPTKRISVQALDKKERNGVDERVLIVRIKYADGSEWQMQ